MQAVLEFHLLIGAVVSAVGPLIRMDADSPSHAAPMVADPLSRWVAKFLDLLVATAMSHFVPPVGFWGGLTYLFIADGLHSGHSLGKRALGLAIRGPHGRTCGVRESIMRNVPVAVPYAVWHLLGQGGWIMAGVGWIVLVVACGVEGVLLAGNPQGRRLGDELAGTSVVGIAVTDRV
jgi:uncharacterized RDD family membrane protein YckC